MAVSEELTLRQTEKYWNPFQTVEAQAPLVRRPQSLRQRWRFRTRHRQAPDCYGSSHRESLATVFKRKRKKLIPAAISMALLSHSLRLSRYSRERGTPTNGTGLGTV